MTGLVDRLLRLWHSDGMTTTKTATVGSGPDAGRPWYPGMAYTGGPDDADARCMQCDGRYCSDHCHAYSDRVECVGKGWVSLEQAAAICAEWQARHVDAPASDRGYFDYAANLVRWNVHGWLPVA